MQHTAHCLTLLSLLMYLCALMCEYHWTVTLRPLLASHRWEDEDQKRLAQTYYPRNCNHEDVSTSNFTDLIVPATWDYTRAAENILTHGVSIFPNIIDRTTADGFRNFTLEKNARMSKEDLVYVMNTYTHNKKQTRWAFAFTAHDHPSIPLVLKQVVENERLRQTLEFFSRPRSSPDQDADDYSCLQGRTSGVALGRESQGECQVPCSKLYASFQSLYSTTRHDIRYGEHRSLSGQPLLQFDGGRHVASVWTSVFGVRSE